MNQQEKSLVIAMDGPAASGKSTVGKILAERLGFFYFDTGVMYRAATLAALNYLGSVEDEQAVTGLAERIVIDVRPSSLEDGRVMDVLLDGKDVTWEIRTSEVERNVSQVSAYAGVRKALTEQQRKIGQRGNMVMAGRDIGTVVFPDAAFKIYLDASPQERARRRLLELEKRGLSASYDEILNGIIQRDKIDSTREHAPLKAAADAYIVNTDGKTVEQVVQECLQITGLKPIN
ncbi:MAG: (d)CMP kinase [Anaerolineaceae bacterium]